MDMGNATSVPAPSTLISRTRYKRKLIRSDSPFLSQLFKMKVISLIFLVCLVSYTYGWVARGTTPDDKKEGHPDQCWYEEIGYIKSGVTKKLPKECVAIICDKGGEFTLNGCGTQSFDPACKLKEPDLSKPYPDCCKRECVKER